MKEDLEILMDERIVNGNIERENYVFFDRGLLNIVLLPLTFAKWNIIMLDNFARGRLVKIIDCKFREVKEAVK